MVAHPRMEAMNPQTKMVPASTITPMIVNQITGPLKAMALSSRVFRERSWSTDENKIAKIPGKNMAKER